MIPVCLFVLCCLFVCFVIAKGFQLITTFLQKESIGRIMDIPYYDEETGMYLDEILTKQTIYQHRLF